jgi:cytochrome c-type biogenesis protein CcmH/NrfG
MEVSDQQNLRPWNNAQAYTLAVICLILGTAVGYLLNAPKGASSGVPAATVTPRPAAGGGKGSMPNAADLKRMADKQVAPLLAELQKNPKDADLLSKIGQSYLAAQQFQTAQQYLEQSVAVKANPENMNALAFVYYSMGDVDKGIETLNRALKIDPKDAKVLFNLGMYEWHGKSNPKAAIAAWQAFVKANPNDPKRPDVEKMIAQAKRHLNLAPGAKTDKPTM